MIMHVHLKTHLKPILGALFLCTLKITIMHLVSWQKIIKSFLMTVDKKNFLSFLWHFLKTFQEQVARLKNYFSLKLITNYNYNQMDDPRSLRDRWLFNEMVNLYHLIRHNHQLISSLSKLINRHYKR